MASFALKQQYRPYVPDFLSLCERNYAQLRFLLRTSSERHASTKAFKSMRLKPIELLCWRKRHLPQLCA
ncbi:MAG: hypothetical protein U5L01_07615 [Rheinheimera sp.]|nr:hypothetical protein [Rheinheimera sp.]